MKIRLEYHIPGDGRKFLNFWDSMHGADVCCELKDGKLWLSQYDENGEEQPEIEISFLDFLERVEASFVAGAAGF